LPITCVFSTPHLAPGRVFRAGWVSKSVAPGIARLRTTAMRTQRASKASDQTTRNGKFLGLRFVKKNNAARGRFFFADRRGMDAQDRHAMLSSRPETLGRERDYVLVSAAAAASKRHARQRLRHPLEPRRVGTGWHVTAGVSPLGTALRACQPSRGRLETAPSDPPFHDRLA